LSVSAEVALYNYQAAKKEYQELHPKASQLQVGFLQQKLLSPGFPEENQQSIYCILTAEVEVPGPNGPTHLTSQQDVEQHLSDALALYFQLTSHSPFLTDPLCYELGLLGASPASQAILQCSYKCPTGVNPYTQQLISILQIPQQSFPHCLWY